MRRLDTIGQGLIVLLIWVPLGLLMAVGGFGVLSWSDSRNREKLKAYAIAEARSISNLIEPVYAAATSIGTLIEYEASDEALEDYAQELGRRFPLIRRVSIAPGGIIQQVFPKNQAPNALGLNLLLDNERVSDAQLALYMRSITLTGPYELREGGLGFTARYPVFRKQETQQEEFWGFTSIVFFLDTLLDLSGLSELQDKGYRWALGTMGNKSVIGASEARLVTEEGENGVLYRGSTIFSSSSMDLVNPVSAEILVLNTAWQLFLEEDTATPLMARWLVLLVGSIALSGIISIFAGLYLDRNRTLLREVAEHKATSEQLARLVSSRELLLRETHHRIKNNLAIVESLVSLQSSEASGTRFEEIFAQLQKRIHSVSLIHEKLYRSTELDRVPAASYATELVDFIRDSTGSEDQPIILDVDKMDFSSKAGLSVGLILTELCMNAIKHGAAGTVRIGLKRHFDLIILSVENEGRELPENFRESTGLGLRLVDSLTTQLGGEWRAENGPPVVFSIMFPAINALASRFSSEDDEVPVTGI